MDFNYPEPFGVFLNTEKRYNILTGGRSSGKSWFLAQKFLVGMMTKPRRDLLCVRQFQANIGESNHKLFKNLILLHDLPFDIIKDKIVSRINQSEILFIGLSKTTENNIKSYENFKDCWIEEGQAILESSLHILDPTIRGNDTRIYVSMNPILGVPEKLEDPIFEYLRKNVLDGDILQKHINYVENPFCQESDVKQAEAMKVKNFDLYKHIWLGEPMPAGLRLINIQDFKYYEKLPEIDYKIIAGDTAMKANERNDYSVFQCWGVKKTKDEFTGNTTKAYLIDMIRGKWEAPELEKHCIAFFNKHKPRKLYIEDKQSGTGLIQNIQRQGRIPVEPLKANKDKVSRVNDILPFIEKGNVFLPTDASYLSDLLKECGAFTRDNTHKHDDIVDTLAYSLYIIGIKRKKIFRIRTV